MKKLFVVMLIIFTVVNLIPLENLKKDLLFSVYDIFVITKIVKPKAIFYELGNDYIILRIFYDLEMEIEGKTYKRILYDNGVITNIDKDSDIYKFFNSEKINSDLKIIYFIREDEIYVFPEFYKSLFKNKILNKVDKIDEDTGMYLLDDQM